MSRALEKLQVLLKHRGVTFSAAGLGTALAGEAVTAAPIGLAAGVAGTAFATAALGTGTTLTFLEFMATSKLKAGIITAVIAASVVAPFLFQHQARASQHGWDEALRRQSDELARLETDNRRLSELLAQPTNSRPDDQFLEVLRLRGEVGRLTLEVREMSAVKTPARLSREDQLASMKQMYAGRVDRLKQWLDAHPSERIPEIKLVSDDVWVTAVRDLETDDNFGWAASGLRGSAEDYMHRTLQRALRKYVADNNGQFPTDLVELKLYIEAPLDGGILQRYEIRAGSSMTGQLAGRGGWVLTTKAPVNAEFDSRQATDLKGSSIDSWKNQ